ncbi:MAG TPA: glycosyltransferase family 39 protein [Pyrinomonadaceae bacterium]|nr:glycosyltransferase family 39 protein [Pyrinomonadaceae bacterium]
MTTPPNRNADDDDADARRPAPSPSDTQPDDTRPTPARRLLAPFVFVVTFAALVVLHVTLLNLPYYWDEAGYFIPAARDIYADGSFVPHSTLSNAHPPLVMAYLALVWKLFGFHIAVARVAMLAVSAFMLTGLFRLAGRVQNTRVAVGTVVCTALYPVFFAQSTLAHLDMTVAALTIWALVFYFPPRDGGTSLRGVKTPSQAHATPLQTDATPSQDRATPLQGGVSSLQDGVTPLRGGVTTLQDDVRALRRGVTSLQGGVEPWRRRAACVALLALAALAKETALLVPLTLCAWELVCRAARRWERVGALVCVGRVRRPVWWTLSLLLACVPLALWFAYHRSVTGYTFGNPEYFRYNVESTLSLPRILEALWGRLTHVTTHMNLWVLTLPGVAAMFLKPKRDGDRERDRIRASVQLVFLVLVLAHVFALSVVGGAVLARYMLPVLPLVILVWVSTLWRRAPAWPLAVALVCGAFAYRCVVNPSYNYPWEENLAYRDFVLLHRDAARYLADKYPGARVLTSWPATDELRNPYYGYTPRALAVVPVESLKREDLEAPAARRTEYDAALLYSTHGGLSLEDAARLLDARVVFHEERKGQWVAVVEVSGRNRER